MVVVFACFFIYFITIYRDVHAVLGEKQYEADEIHSECLPFTENLTST